MSQTTMPQMKLFSVTVKLRSQPVADYYEVGAPDAACALGVTLDELQEEYGAEPDVETVTISSDVVEPNRTALPQQVWDAFELALAEKPRSETP